MKQKIPKKERWLHTPEMKAKLARADEWMRDNPPRETDMDESDRRFAESVAKASPGNIVLHLYLDYEFVPIRSHRPIMNIIERLGWKPYDLGGDYVYSRSDSTFRDALDLLKAMKAGLPWFDQALHAAWTLEATEAIDLKPVLDPVADMTQTDKARQWMDENAKAIESSNAYVEKNGLPLARFTDLGQDPDETILQLTDEQIPRFVAAAKAGKGLPPDIVASFMQQLFPDDQPTYEPDEGPLTEAELNQIRAQAAPKLGKGPVLRRRSLLEGDDD